MRPLAFVAVGLLVVMAVACQNPVSTVHATLPPIPESASPASADGGDGPGFTPMVALTDPHNHVVDVNSDWVPPQIQAKVRFEEVTLDSSLQRKELTVSPEGTFRVFLVEGLLQSGYFRDRLIVEDNRSSKTYEIQGLPEPWRPFSSLVWLTDQILVFDRGSQPHYGWHYAVDVRAGQLLLASPFPDELP